MTLIIKKPAALFEGGPWDGWARYEDEMPELLRAYERTGVPFDYEPTDRFIVHPRTNGKTNSRVWTWTK